jgi:hypothetical protein
VIHLFLVIEHQSGGQTAQSGGKEPQSGLAQTVTVRELWGILEELLEIAFCHRVHEY